MSCNFAGLRTRFRREAAMRYFGGIVLCALLLILCTSAKLARYEIHKPTLKLASTQAYLDGEEIRKELSKTAPLVSLVGVIAVPFLILRKARLRPVVLSSSLSFKGFDPESCLRPPPAR
jgi:hypothetical protein